MIFETLIELALAGMGTTATAGIMVAARSGTWDKSELEIATERTRVHVRVPETPLPAMDPWPVGFVPTAFWNLADWSAGDNMRDGAPPFWMRDPIEHIVPDDTEIARLPPSVVTAKSYSEHGACPNCGEGCRRVEIDGGKYYSCSNHACRKHSEAWSAGNKSYVLVRRPTRWVERKLCLYDDAHGWYIKPKGPINYDE